jgi:flavin reductase (DIM6/NTAB) family NADH-FMN oxidoreductase RutF
MGSPSTAPRELPNMISFVTQEMENPAPYHLLTSVVAPRPIAWVSTISAQGEPNLAPYSFYNAVAGFPPTLMFSVSYRRQEPREKDTLRNVKEVGEFVCHVADESLSGAMVKTAMDFPHGTSEFAAAGLEAVPAIAVKPWVIQGAPVAMECQVTQIVPVEGATNVMVLGQVVRFHVRQDLYRSQLGLVDTVQMQPITRLGGPVEYTKIGELFSLPIPNV